MNTISAGLVGGRPLGRSEAIRGRTRRLAARRSARCRLPFGGAGQFAAIEARSHRADRPTGLRQRLAEPLGDPNCGCLRPRDDLAALLVQNAVLDVRVHPLPPGNLESQLANVGGGQALLDLRAIGSAYIDRLRGGIEGVIRRRARRF